MRPNDKKSAVIYRCSAHCQAGTGEKIWKFSRRNGFYISIPGEPIVEKNTALAINSEGNTKVKELLDSLYI